MVQPVVNYYSLLMTFQTWIVVATFNKSKSSYHFNSTAVKILKLMIKQSGPRDLSC